MQIYCEEKGKRKDSVSVTQKVTVFLSDACNTQLAVSGVHCCGVLFTSCLVTYIMNLYRLETRLLSLYCTSQKWLVCSVLLSF